MTEQERIEMAIEIDDEFNIMLNNAICSLYTIDDAINIIRENGIAKEFSNDEIIKEMQKEGWLDECKNATLKSILEDYMKNVDTEIEYPVDLIGEGDGGTFCEITMSYVTNSGMEWLARFMYDMERR